jgi:beta-lactamase superfamily II metal-dependent hydrolase
MFPAAYGDCLWIEYGPSSRPRRVLIDGGISSTYKKLRERIRALPEDDRHFELFIITHVDADHIEGSIRLLGGMRTHGVTFGDVWFNGHDHLNNLPPSDLLGGAMGEYLSVLIERRRVPWNKAFDKQAVMAPDEGPLPTVELDGGLKLTVLSPTLATLQALLVAWDKEVEKAGLDRKSVKAVLEALRARRALRPEDDFDDELGEEEIDVRALADRQTKPDTSEANGSSIAVLAEFDDPEDGRTKRCLLTGDAFAPVLRASLLRHLGGSGVLSIDALKLPHHGSKSNVSRELLELLRCRSFLFSSNGRRHGHPDPEGVARVIVYGRSGGHPELVFNYRTEINEVWEAGASAGGDDRYTVRYPQSADGGIEVDL